jgi:hypothetical protein
VSDWHVLYEAALSETNPSVLEQLISETEYAIRLEDSEIKDALRTLLQLKIERLGPVPLARSWRQTIVS